MQLTLYVDGYFVNQWDGTCIVALTEKGVPFTTSRALLRDGAGVPQALKQLTGTARVPALQHGDFWLTESVAIAEYLERLLPPPQWPALLPPEPRARARAIQIMIWLRIELRALRDERPWWMSVYPSAPRPLSAAAAHDAAELIAFAEHLVRTGELGAWNLAHVDLALTLMRLANTGHALPDAAARVVAETCARPSVRAYLDHQRPPNPPPFAPG